VCGIHNGYSWRTAPRAGWSAVANRPGWAIRSDANPRSAALGEQIPCRDHAGGLVDGRGDRFGLLAAVVRPTTASVPPVDERNSTATVHFVSPNDFSRRRSKRLLPRQVRCSHKPGAPATGRFARPRRWRSGLVGSFAPTSYARANRLGSSAQNLLGSGASLCAFHPVRRADRLQQEEFISHRCPKAGH
jgi:hypothetical protein